MTNTSVLIVGGGLSGCLVARELSARGIEFQLIEARDRLGGRILSLPVDDTGNATGAVDLGPSWFWPHQRGLIKLIQSLELEQAVYEQSHRGDSVIEYDNGQLERRAGAVSMAGSYRIDGGMQTLINRIIANIPDDAFLLNTRLKAVSTNNDSITAVIESSRGTRTFDYQSIVMALPPRLIATSVNWLDNNTSYLPALESVATWMATEAKVTLIYDSPFWQKSGLSGDAMSQIGPLGEVHDATPRNSSRGALFGFVSARPQQRAGNAKQIKQRSAEQIQRMFNTNLLPSQILYKDWSFDEFTASETDRTSQRAHPSSASLQQTGTGKRIIWAVSEAAGQDAGYLEGAVVAANTAISELLI